MMLKKLLLLFYVKNCHIGMMRFNQILNVLKFVFDPNVEVVNTFM